MVGVVGSPDEDDVALLAEGVGRNVRGHIRGGRSHPSPSSRRAWVEMPVKLACSATISVALLAEGVGRNQKHRAAEDDKWVALLAEGVDKNRESLAPSGISWAG